MNIISGVLSSTHIVWHACCWEKERKASRMTRREHTVHHNVISLLKSEVISLSRSWFSGSGVFFFDLKVVHGKWKNEARMILWWTLRTNSCPMQLIRAAAWSLCGQSSISAQSSTLCLLVWSSRCEHQARCCVFLNWNKSFTAVLNAIMKILFFC